MGFPLPLGEGQGEGVYKDVAGFCKSATRDEIRKHGYPPDKQEKATQTVLEQAELLSEGWAEEAA